MASSRSSRKAYKLGRAKNTPLEEGGDSKKLPSAGELKRRLAAREAAALAAHRKREAEASAESESLRAVRLMREEKAAALRASKDAKRGKR